MKKSEPNKPPQQTFLGSLKKFEESNNVSQEELPLKQFLDVIAAKKFELIPTDFEDDYQSQINELNGEHFLERIDTEIEDEQGNIIGEFTGYLLKTDEILKDTAGSFVVMDSISDLLYKAHSFVKKHEDLLKTKQTALFLNRLSLYETYDNGFYENAILKFLLEKYNTVIYSLGYTELQDSEFFEYQDALYINFWKQELPHDGWTYDTELEFYFKMT